MAVATFAEPRKKSRNIDILRSKTWNPCNSWGRASFWEHTCDMIMVSAMTDCFGNPQSRAVSRKWHLFKLWDLGRLPRRSLPHLLKCGQNAIIFHQLNSDIFASCHLYSLHLAKYDINVHVWGDANDAILAPAREELLSLIPFALGGLSYASFAS